MTLTYMEGSKEILRLEVGNSKILGRTVAYSDVKETLFNKLEDLGESGNKMSRLGQLAGCY
jgi:hypothetical protein